MSITEGHRLAIEQLRKLERHRTRSLEIVEISDTPNEHGYLHIIVSISCDGIEIIPEGLQLKQRELIQIAVPALFPFNVPSAFFTTFDYTESPHVQWGRSICLYLSKDLDWNPNDGMFGFIERLGNWLIRAGIDQLDQTGEALHPPSTFAGERSQYSICSSIDLPKTSEPYWQGAVLLSPINPTTFEIKKWITGIPNNRDSYSAVLVLNEKMPYEYPATVNGLFTLLEKKGHALIDIIRFLQSIVLKKKNKTPLFFFICSPMMGIRGDDNLRHHIACWEIDDRAVKNLRALYNTYSSQSSKAEKRRKIAISNLADWSVKSETKWCTVLENRPEVTLRRDINTNMSVFSGKRVRLLGCGALGAHIASMLARANVKSLVLHDNKDVNPGILVRQPFRKTQWGINKAVALKQMIDEITDDVTVTVDTSDISDMLLSGEDTIFDTNEIIIDCTASNRIRFLLEHRFLNIAMKPQMVSMSIDLNMGSGIVVCIGKTFSCSLYGGYRKTLIHACRNKEVTGLAQRYLEKPAVPFQPIPGCSEPTFISSASDAMLYSSHLLNIAAQHLNDDDDIMTSALIAHLNDRSIVSIMTTHSDSILKDCNSGYSVHISDNAWKQIKRNIQSNKNKKNETGGLLFGERNDVLKTIWIDEVTGAPPDSKASPTKFVCGVQGVKELSEEFKKKYFNQIVSIGTWHTHPKSLPFPSMTDLQGVAGILAQNDVNREKILLLILQPKTEDEFILGAYLFVKDEDEHGNHVVKVQV